jgi:YVTN family beta-propeller protein
VKLLAVAFAALFVVAPTKKIDVGQFSFGLAAGGGSVWVGGLGAGDVQRIDPASGKVVAHITVGPRVFNLAPAPGAVWAISNVSSTAVRIDTRTNKVTNTVPVGFGPYDIEWGFGSAWVSNSGEGTVSRITNGRVVKKIKVGTEPNGLTAYRGYLWVADHTEGRLLRIDPRTNRVTGGATVAGADWVVGLGNSLYVSEETNKVLRIDVNLKGARRYAEVDRNPLGAAIVDGKLWVPCIDANMIDVIDPATMKVVARKPGGPGPIVVLPAFGHVWVSHTIGNAIWRL